MHIPFCVRKCPYCGFFSTQYESTLADRYLRAVQKELMLHWSTIEDRGIGTVYIGGGTPTALSLGQLSFLFEKILRRAGCVTPEAEVTIEVNPGTVSCSLFDLLRSIGATRLSIGVQSFSDDILAFLGRVHRAQDARQAVAMARAAGFANIGLDLMYAVPGQTMDHWRATVDEALALGPEHLSVYSLSLDEGSRFSDDARLGRLVLPSDAAAADMYVMAGELLEQHGYEHYELSNFARPGFACKHNLNYWSRGEYLGVGAGAWSFIDGMRSANISDVQGYINRLERESTPRTFEERPGPAEAASETLLLALRTSSGVDLERFAASFGGAAYASLLASIGRHRSSGLYEVVGGTLRLTRRGMLVADSAMEALFP